MSGPTPRSLTERTPRRSADELATSFVPPARFDDVRFETYLPSPEHPSQAQALDASRRFAATVVAGDRPKRRFWQRDAGAGAGPKGLYLDGGFGVGKTHLLASTWHASPGPKAYLTFAELAAYVGFVGMQSAVESLGGHRLLCIDEFELDDVANTRMASSLLRTLTDAGVRIAATSNTLPDRMGEGRFSAAEFARELSAVAGVFEVLRVDGPDYRAASRRYDVDALDDEELAAVLASAPDGGVVTDDPFDDVLAHLRRVPPVQLHALVEGVDLVAVRGLHPIAEQGGALLFVQLIDELYDAGITVGASGCRVDELFPASYRHGTYRKKYGRCESRLEALLAEARTSIAHDRPSR